MFYNTYHPSCVAHGWTNIWPGVDSIDDRSPRRYLPTATSTFLVLPEDAVMINLRTRPVSGPPLQGAVELISKLLCLSKQKREAVAAFSGFQCMKSQGEAYLSNITYRSACQKMVS